MSKFINLKQLLCAENKQDDCVIHGLDVPENPQDLKNYMEP
jgi:hypothetical protein